MQELRFVAVSEDGSYAVLAVPGRSGRYILPIDERLRAVAQGQTTRLAQYEIEVESPLRPKEIQARIRAGETAEEIADAAGIPVERVRWFEGPVLAERAYVADQAQSGSVRRAGDSAGPRLGDIVAARLSAAGTDPADGQWDSRKRGDGNWQVALTFPSGGRLHVAEWVFDPRRRHVMPDDDNAARLSLPESELPAEPVPMPGEATVTPIASRLGAVAGMGGGSVGGPGVSRFRPERSVIPDRSLGADRSLAERPAPPSVQGPERTAMPDRSAAAERPAAPAPSRPAQQDRPGYQGRPGNPGYAEFPESAPYRAPERAADVPPAAQVPAPAADLDQPAPAAPPAAAPAAVREAPAPAAGQAPAAAPAASSVVTPEDTPVPAPAVTVAPPEIYEIEPAAAQAEPARAAATAPAAEPEVAAAAAAPPRDKPAGPAAEVAPVMAADRRSAATAGAVAPAAASAPARPVSAAEPAAPDATGPAARPEPAAAVTPEVPAPAEPAPAEDQPSRSRPGAKKNAKARRSSVPSWDEIMLGSSRQRD